MVRTEWNTMEESRFKGVWVKAQDTLDISPGRPHAQRRRTHTKGAAQSPTAAPTCCYRALSGEKQMGSGHSEVYTDVHARTDRTKGSAAANLPQPLSLRTLLLRGHVEARLEVKNATRDAKKRNQVRDTVLFSKHEGTPPPQTRAEWHQACWRSRRW